MNGPVGGSLPPAHHDVTPGGKVFIIQARVEMYTLAYL